MDLIQKERNSRQVARWLLLGVAMIIVQVLIGGITRLTESGLSITEWKPITGALPPLNEAAWQSEFDKYKVTDQFKYIHPNFSLSDFKYIFFWEWFHRVWARLMGMVFLVGFIYFLARKKFNREMIKPMILLFFLGALQGLIGWIMVKSGLVPEKYFVGHVELSTHFIAALGLLAYTTWFALSLLVKPDQQLIAPGLQKYLLAILAVFVIQLFYGAFMAGLKAAPVAPSWPDINGRMLPETLTEYQPFWKNLLNNPIAIHFIHRGLAYLLLIIVIVWWIKSKTIPGKPFFSRLRRALMLLFVLQVVLGIFTVLNATKPKPFVVLGVSHQFVAILLLMVLTALLFLVRKKMRVS